MSVGRELRAAQREAARLLEQWTRLAREHVAGAAGCSCGHGGVMLRLEDFEQDILDHLYARYAGDAGVSALLRDKAGYRVGEAGSVPALLGAVAEGRHADAGADGAKALVADLARSIGSFDSLHRGG